MNNFLEPNPGFVVISDNKGNVVDFDCPNFDSNQLNELVGYLNLNFPNRAPYCAWKCNGSFERVITE